MFVKAHNLSRYWDGLNKMVEFCEENDLTSENIERWKIYHAQVKVLIERYSLNNLETESKPNHYLVKTYGTKC
jgi:hypothetical protein